MNLQRLIGVFQKIFSKGVVWFFVRGKSETRTPRFRFMKNLMTTGKKLKRSVSTLFVEDKRLGDEYVTAVYDLNHQSNSFDFAFFLTAAELFARENGKDSFVVLILSPQKILTAIGNDEHTSQWRLENIVLPLVNLCPACIGHSVIPTTANITEMVKDKLVYPDFYDGEYTPSDYHIEVYNSKIKFTGLRASVEGVRQIKLWKKHHNLTDNIVTITLRRYLYDSIRDSNVDEWIKFAERISRDNFTPVFIPDTFSCFEQDSRLDDFIVFKEPCWNLGLRMALYEESFVNFFGPHGPAVPAYLNKNVTSICMNMLVPDSLQSSEESYKKRGGISVGQRKYGFVEGYRVLSWEEDTVENIYSEFNEFLANQFLANH